VALIQVGTVDCETGAEVTGSLLRTGSPQAAVDHAWQLKAQYTWPRYTARIVYVGEFVDPAMPVKTGLKCVSRKIARSL